MQSKLKQDIDAGIVATKQEIAEYAADQEKYKANVD